MCGSAAHPELDVRRQLLVLLRAVRPPLWRPLRRVRAAAAAFLVLVLLGLGGLLRQSLLALLAGGLGLGLERREGLEQQHVRRLAPLAALERDRDRAVDAALDEVARRRAVVAREEARKLAAVTLDLPPESNHLVREQHADALVHRGADLVGEALARLQRAHDAAA